LTFVSSSLGSNTFDVVMVEFLLSSARDNEQVRWRRAGVSGEHRDSPKI
jgi:hypothetical protein